MLNLWVSFGFVVWITPRLLFKFPELTEKAVLALCGWQKKSQKLRILILPNET